MIKIDEKGFCSCVKKSNAKLSFVHATFEDVVMVSNKISIEMLSTDSSLVHPYAFPPPFNKYLIPRDVYFRHKNARVDMTLEMITEAINNARVIMKKCISTQFYMKKEKENVMQDDTIEDDDDNEDEDEDEDDGDDDDDDDDSEEEEEEDLEDPIFTEELTK